MIKTASTCYIDAYGNIREDTITCETVGHTEKGQAIWKEVDDAYACYVFQHGLFHPIAIWPEDQLTDLYGTYVDERGKRVDAWAISL